MKSTNEPTEQGPAQEAFWLSLIDEIAAATFLGLSPRTLQMFRQKGGGPLFVRVSSRCIRYRRSDLKGWADARLACSTSDVGAAV